MPNEVVIHVKAKKDASVDAVFKQVQRDAQKAGDQIGGELSDGISERVEKDAKSDAGGGYAKAGDAIGDTIGRHVTTKISENISRYVVPGIDKIGGGDTNKNHTLPGTLGGKGDDKNVLPDIDKQSRSWLSKFASLGTKASDMFNGGFAAGIQSFFSSDIITKFIIAGLGISLLPVLTAFIGGALSSALLLALGTGGIAVGVVAALKDPRIKGALEDFKLRAGEVFKNFGEPFVKPVESFIRNLGPMLGDLTPQFEHLGEVLGPVAQKLGDGIIGFLKKNLPAISKAMEAAAPIVETLASHLQGGLADAFESFFTSLEESGPEAKIFFEDLLGAIEITIKALGKFIEAGAKLWTSVRPYIQALVRGFMDAMLFVAEAAVRAFGWVPGLGPKLTKARDGIARFRKQVNDELDKINRNVNITVRTLYIDPKTGRGFSSGAGQSRDNGKASGGVVGAAAAGGARSSLTWVGEYGPELLNLPAGSSVRSTGDSSRIAAQRGGGGMPPMVVNLMLDGRKLATAMLDPLRSISDQYGGDVQAMMGRSY